MRTAAKDRRCAPGPWNLLEIHRAFGKGPAAGACPGNLFTRYGRAYHQPAPWRGSCLKINVDRSSGSIKETRVEQWFVFNIDQVLGFMLVLFRISLILFFMPFFGSQVIPNPAKAILCIVFSLAVFPKLSFSGHAFPASALGIALLFVGEAILALVFDLAVRVVFAAVQLGGELAGFSMGFSVGNMFNPMTGQQESSLSQLMYQFAIMVFLSGNGHLFLIKALGESFALVPPGGVIDLTVKASGLLAFSSQIFLLAIKIAAPVVASLFMVDLALALVSRAAPQMNVLFIGFPVKLGVGFLFIIMTFTAMARFLGEFATELPGLYENLMRGAG